MGYTIHLFPPETWGFHIDLVTEDVEAPLRLKINSHSFDPSQNKGSYMMSLAFLFYMMTMKKVLLFLAYVFLFFFVFFIKPCTKPMSCYLLLWNFPFHCQTVKFPIDQEFSADKNETYVVAWQFPKPCQQFFLWWPVIIGLCLNGRCWVSWVQICSAT